MGPKGDNGLNRDCVSLATHLNSKSNSK